MYRSGHHKQRLDKIRAILGCETGHEVDALQELVEYAQEPEPEPPPTAHRQEFPSGKLAGLIQKAFPDWSTEQRRRLVSTIQALTDVWSPDPGTRQAAFEQLSSLVSGNGTS